MLRDISLARKSIYLETYIYTNDKIGRLFRDALAKKSREGVKVLILIDSYGGKEINAAFFQKDAKNEEIRFFKNDFHIFKVLFKEHEVNHRKLLIVDEKMVYFGSTNITENCLDWRELNLRIGGDITRHFADSFKYSWNLSQKLNKKKLKLVLHKGFEILHDIPRIKGFMQNKYVKMLKQARSEILIETPYFVPTLRIRRALRKAVKRGVRVKIILPHKSDLFLFDIIRNRYLSSLYKAGVEIFYYMPRILHSKLLMVDNKFFLLGSSNLDFRSFFQDHQLNLFGRDKKMISELRKFFDSGMAHSKPFNYEEWKSRSSFTKIIELVLSAVEERL